MPKGTSTHNSLFPPGTEGRLGGHALWAVMLILVGGMAFSLT
jgi:hypothetical protein